MAGSESGFSEVVVTVAAKTLDCEGHLTLYKQSDTLYTVEFRDVEERNVVKADIDSVHVDVKRQAIRIQEPDEEGDLDLLIDIPDRQHLQIFHDAQRECQEICNLTLELVTRLRDIYYAGVFRSVFPGSAVVVGPAAAGLLIDARINFIRRCISSRPAMKTPKRRKRSNGSAVSSSQAALGEAEEDLVGGELIAEDGPVACFYCSCTEKGSKHFVHPYVPRNYELQPIFMCEQCIESWKYYRDLAMQEQQLVLPGEVNEEVCAMCSDTPDMLILCNHCTRSYCEACLRRVVEKKTVDAIVDQDAQDNDLDWQCLSCAAKVSRKPLLTREAWTRVEVRSKHFRKVSRRADSDDEDQTPKNASPRPRKLTVAHSAATGTAGKSGGPLPLDTKASRFKFKRELKRALEEAVDEAPHLPDAGFLIYNREVGADSGRPSRKVMPSKKLREAVSLMKRRASSLPSASRAGDPSTSAIIVARESDGVALPASSETGELLDETHYFSQYVQTLDVPPGPQTADQPTEDVCFLCKDGGDVIECDWRCDTRSSGGGRRGQKARCLKVYHQGCLGYEVADNIKWHCPRHFCSVCGAKEIKFVCVFCPISVCAACPDALATKFRLNRYCLMPSAGDGGGKDIVSIACESCINLFRNGKERGLLPRKLFAPSFAAVQTFRPTLTDQDSDPANGEGNGHDTDLVSSEFVAVPPPTSASSKADKSRRSQDRIHAADLQPVAFRRRDDPPTTEDFETSVSTALAKEAVGVDISEGSAELDEPQPKGEAKRTMPGSRAGKRASTALSMPERAQAEGEELGGSSSAEAVSPSIRFTGKFSNARRHSTGSLRDRDQKESRGARMRAQMGDTSGQALAEDNQAPADESARLSKRVTRSRV